MAVSETELGAETNNCMQAHKLLLLYTPWAVSVRSFRELWLQEGFEAVAAAAVSHQCNELRGTSPVSEWYKPPEAPAELYVIHLLLEKEEKRGACQTFEMAAELIP